MDEWYKIDEMTGLGGVSYQILTNLSVTSILIQVDFQAQKLHRLAVLLYTTVLCSTIVHHRTS